MRLSHLFPSRLRLKPTREKSPEGSGPGAIEKYWGVSCVCQFDSDQSLEWFLGALDTDRRVQGSQHFYPHTHQLKGSATKQCVVCQRVCPRLTSYG